MWHPIVGTAAVYDVQKEGRPNQTFEFAVVGKETAQGKDAVWIEFTMNLENLGSLGNSDMVVKELVSFDPSKMQMQLFKAVMQMSGRPPMLMPDEMIHTRQPFQFDDVRAKNVDLGSESLTTPAGTFPCEHYRSKDASDEFWVSEKVAPIGLVKSAQKGQTVVLKKTITDAADKITGTPQPFNPMMFMPPSKE